MASRRQSGQTLVNRRLCLNAGLACTVAVEAAAAPDENGALYMNTGSVVPLVKQVADHLMQVDVSVLSLTRLLGSVKEKYSGSGYYLRPADERLANVWIGIRQPAGGTEQPSDVGLFFTPQAAPTLAAVELAFGRRKLLPPAPNGPLYKVRFVLTPDYAGPGLYSATVLATLSGDPGMPSTVVPNLTIRRDPR